MLTSVKYAWEPGAFAWPIPFAYSHAAQVEAALMDETGMERKLVQGKDYQVSGQNVICLVPEGCSLCLSLNAPVAEVRAANQAQALAGMAGMAAGPQYMAAGNAAPAQAAQDIQARNIPAYDPALTQPVQTAQTAEDSRLAQLEEQIAALQDERDLALIAARASEKDAQVKAVADTGREARAGVEAAAANAMTDMQALASEAQGALAAAELDAQSIASHCEDTAARAAAAADAAEAKSAQAAAALERRIAELEQRLETIAAAKEQAIQRAADQGNVQIGQAARAAMREAEARCKLSGEAWPQAGAWEAREAYPAGTILPLPEPLRYYPGRQALYIFCNGKYLTPGKDFQEAGSTLSSSWRPMRDVLMGDLFDFVIAPTNAGQAAALHARDAGRAAAAAQGYAAGASRLTEAARQQWEAARGEKNQAAAHAGRARDWSALAQDECRAANAASNEAAAHAWQASIVSARPGIAAVNDAAQLARVVEGVYFINPHLLQAPTPFYGLWPVADLAAPILWDGVFFEGPAYERAPYGPPPACPCPTPPAPPEDVEIVPGHNPAEWLPCDHIHCKHHCHKDHDNA